MKKLLALVLVLTLAFVFVGCTQPTDNGQAVDNQNQGEQNIEVPETPVGDEGGDNSISFDNLTGGETDADNTDNAETSAVMTYAEYIAAEMDSPVLIEAYVQATQSWWKDKITVYAQNQDGAYFIYEMACSEENATKLVPGTKIRVSGYKTQWSGEIEIVDSTFEIIEGEGYIAEATDVTALLGTEELINHQNKLAAFKGMTVDAIEYKNGEPGDDIYVTVSKDGVAYSFCVEVYLTGPDTDVYKTVQGLKAGDVVDIEGFLYWYEGVNTHITAVTVAA